MEDQNWDKERHELRTRADQRFRARHPERVVSLSKKRDDVSIWTRRAQMKRHETVSGVAAKDRFGIGEDVGNAEEPHDRSQAMNAMRSWTDKKVNWQEIEASSHLSPLASPHTKSSSAKRERLAREGRRRANSVISRTPLPKSPANRFGAEQGISPKVKHGLDIVPAREGRRRANSIISRTPLPKSPANRFGTEQGKSPKVKHGLDLVPEHQPSESERSESSHDVDSRNPSLPGDGDSHQGPFEYVNRHAKEHDLQKSQQKGMDSGHDPQIRTSDSGFGRFDDAQVDFGIWNPSDQQRKDHVPLPKVPIIEQSIDETDDSKKKVVSDNSKKPDHHETSSETPPDPNEYEHYSPDVQLPQSEPEAPLTDATHQYVPDGDHSDQAIFEAEEATESPPTPGVIDQLDRDSQPISPRSDDVEHLDPQTSPFRSEQNKSPYIVQNFDTTPLAGDESPDAQQTSPGHDSMIIPNQRSESHGDGHLRGPDLEFISPESGGVTVNATPVQDRLRKDEDAQARLNSHAPLREIDRASSHDSQEHRSSRPDRSYDAGSDKDSLVVSPARSDELEDSEDEDWDRVAIVNDNIIRMFNEYKASSQLEPTSEEQEARYWRKAKKAADKQNRSPPGIDSKPSSISTPSSDASFLLSPDQYNEESRTNAEPGLDDLKQLEEGEEEEEEEVDENVMNLIELHRANHELRKDIEAKEAKFEQEIKVAWNRPRPPPITEDQIRDRIALEKIESKEIFDELGDQQRPINTDAYLIVRETQIDIMITRARTCYILKDYRGMYTRANQAVEAASLLRYPPLMARCCYYRGMASYHHGDLSSARDDFVEARGCAGLFGITSQSIERYIHFIDSGVDPETARLERLSAPRVGRDRDTGRTRRARRNESSPSSADATTLVGDLSRSPEHHPTDPAHDNLDSHPQISRRRTQTPALAPPDDDRPPPAIDGLPRYQLQDEAISEAIRKDILESKARSLNDAAPSNAKTTQQATTQNQAIPPSSSSPATTEKTFYGTASNTSLGLGTTRHVSRPHIAPITTSLVPTTTTARDSVREHAPGPSGDMDDVYERSSDEMGSDEMYAAFGGRFREGDTPDSAMTPVSARWPYK